MPAVESPAGVGLFLGSRFPAENPGNSLHVEFLGAVVVVNAVLLLLYVRELGVAVAAYVFL